MKRLCLYLSSALSLLIFLILLVVSNHMAGGQSAQQMAGRWSEENDVTQVSCFFSVDAGVTEDRIKGFEHSLEDSLKEASIVQDSENPSARLWIDAYSATGKVTITSDRTTLTADAIGIGGDFFQFHPLQLKNGSYFSGNDLMQDYCVIDEDAAWQLFGSNNVAGQIVTIGNVPHIITGVVERPQGKMEENAGLSQTVVYVSYQTLKEYGTDYGINHYEIVMPNPVTGFAMNLVKEKIGVGEEYMEVVENTTRYSLLSRLQIIRDFGSRSMNGKAIIYPYWENIARGTEDILALLTLLEILFLLYPITVAIVLLVKWWKHKNWTIMSLYHRIQDKGERFLERRREQKLQKTKQEIKYEKSNAQP
ncbi:MAG: ABC transporter permease [Lachnospiraceae bacterium]|nr:ABC transporter permease [Lachnospiraceae bacterium]